MTSRTLKIFFLAWMLLHLIYLPCRAQFYLKESFGGSTVSDKIVLGGSAKLTAVTGSDPLGSGWLRLTDNSVNQVGYCYINQSFPSNLGALIEFEYTAWSPSKTLPEADGFSFYIFDASYGPGTFQLGQDGGALGYGAVDAVAHPTGWTLGAGLTGGYIGLGLDEFGNFSVKHTQGDNTAPGFISQAIALRGPTSLSTKYMIGTSANLGGTVYAGQKISYGSPINQRPVESSFFRKVRILLEKVGTNYQITVSLQVSQSGNMRVVFGPTVLPFAPPPLLKIGFAASTGGFSANHEIKNLYATTPGGVHVEKTGPLLVRNNEPVSYDVNIFNDSQNPQAGIPVTDTLPANFQTTGINFINNGYVNNSYDGNGSVAGNVFAGGKLSLAPYSRATLRFTGKMVFTDSIPVIIRNTAYAKVPAGFPDPDLSNDTTQFISYRKPVLKAEGPINQIICNNTTPSIALTTMSNATIKWSARTTANISGAAGGSATADFLGNYIFGQQLSNNGTTTGSVTYVFTPFYTYVSPVDGSPVVVEGDSVIFTMGVNPLLNIAPVNNIAVCAQTLVSPIGLAGSIPIATYSWHNSLAGIGLASDGSGPSIPAFTALNAGTTQLVASITFTATSNGCVSAPSFFTITVNPLPDAGFAINAATQCQPGNNFIFTNQSTPANLTYNWRFGDGIVSASGSPVHSYLSDGTYVVELLAISNEGCRNSVNHNIVVSPSPVAAFTYSIISPNSNDQFLFTENSTIAGGSITGYFWDFGDGASSSEENPTHTYVSAGTYSVRLTVTGSSGCFTIFTSQVTASKNPNVTGNFTVNAAQQCLAGNNYTFTSTVTAAPGSSIVSYGWDFGDGSTQITSANASHSYPSPGTYIVSLAITTNTGFTETIRQSIVVNATPNVSKPGDQQVCADSKTDAVVFSGTVPGTNYSWQNSNPSIGLTQGGTGNNIPSFTAFNTGSEMSAAVITIIPSANGCNGIPQTMTISVKPKPDVLLPANQAVCSGSATAAVNFSSNVAGTVFNWASDNTEIGSAASGAGNIPSFNAVNAGTIPLTANFLVSPMADGCAGIPRSFAIVVNPIPVLNNSRTPTGICDNTIFSYEPSSQTPGASFNWTRNAVDGINNTAANGTGNPAEILHNGSDSTINVTYVFLISASGCSNTQNVVLPVKPIPLLNSQLNPAAVCSFSPICYSPTSLTQGTVFSWERPSVTGVDNPSSTGSGLIDEALSNTTDLPVNVTYVYTAQAEGCFSSSNVIITVNPVARLSSLPSIPTVCSGVPFRYSPTGTVTGTGFTWSRPVVPGISNMPATSANGINETLQNTTDAAQLVSYLYTLSAYGCTVTQPVTIIINPLPSVLFSVNDADQCLQGNSFIFTNASASLQGISGYTWDTDDGGIFHSADLMHTYASYGSYQAKLIVTGNNGCSDSLVQVVTLNPKPVASFVYTIISPYSDDGYQFTNKSIISSGNISGYAWDFGDGNTSSDVNPVHTFATAGIFTVTLTVTGTGNCAGVLTQTLQVRKEPNIIAAFTTGNSTQCVGGNNFAFLNHTTIGSGGTINSYDWDFGDGTVSSIENPSHTYAGPGIYTVTLSVSGTIGGGVFSDIITGSVEVFASTHMDRPANQTICAGTVSDVIRFTSTDPGVTFNWTNDQPQIGIPASGISGSIAPFVAVNNTSVPVTATVVVSPSINGCAGVAETFSITVNPLPTLTGQASQAVCSGTPSSAISFSSNVGGAVFTWVNDNVATGLPVSGTGSIPSFTGINSSLKPAVSNVIVKPVANGCTGDSASFSITVNPVPVLTSDTSPLAVCDGATFTYVPTSNIPGASFSWSRSVVTGISKPAASAMGNVSEVLRNTTALPVVVAYTFNVTSAEGCVSLPATVRVTINPTPSFSSTLSPPEICNNTFFNYTPASATPGTSFSWSRGAGAGLSNLSAVGANDPNEQLLNITFDITRAIYKYTLSADGCLNTQNVVLVVVPSLRLTSSLTPTAVCSGSIFRYQPASNLTGVAFNWSRAAVPGINEAAASGTGNVAEILTNRSGQSVNVVYSYTISYHGCSLTSPVTVTVNPEPLLTTIPPDQRLCSGQFTNEVHLSSNIAGTKYRWTNSTTDIGLPASGEGDIPSFTALNHSGEPVTAQIRIDANTPVACGIVAPAGFTIQVDPAPTNEIIAPLGTNLCQGSNLPLNTVGGTSYIWYRNGTVIPAATKSQLTVSEAGNYSVSATAAQGCITAGKDTIPVTAIEKPIVDFAYNAYCINTAVTFTDRSIIANSGAVSYTWTDNAGHSSNLSSPVFSFSAAGSYTVRLKVTPQLCALLADSLAKTIAFERPAEGVLLPRVNTVANAPVTLQARDIGNNSYLWIPVTGLSNSTIRNPIATVPANQLYEVQMTMPSGCITTDSILVKVLSDDAIFIPNVITPNSDGKNDRFIIVGLGNYPGSQLTIYNRWQNQVYNSASYNNDWAGAGLSTGTYYYVLKLKKPNVTAIYKGWVEIIR
jgi:gliding motility-associated-like protein